LRQRWRARNSA